MYDYDYVYGYNNAAEASGILAMLGTYLFVIMLVSIFMLVCMWKIYKKAGKNGWEAIVPIYNIIVLLDIVELPTWQIVLFFIPIANIYIIFKIYIELAHKFGKTTGFGIAMVFFGIIFLPMLAFGNSTYVGSNNQTNYTSQMNMQQPNNYYSNQGQQNTNVMPGQVQSINSIQSQPVQEINPQIQAQSIPAQNQNMAAVQPQVINQQAQSATMQNQNINSVQPQQVNSQVQQQVSSVQNQTEKFCPQCGNKVDVNSSACFMCGYKF